MQNQNNEGGDSAAPIMPLRPMVPDFCFDCEAVDYPYQRVMKEIEQEYKGRTYLINASVWVCPHCGSSILGDGDLTEIATKTKAAYLEYLQQK